MIWNREAETMSRAALERWQLEQLKRSLAWAMARVGFYRESLTARVAERIRGHLGLNPEIAVVPPKTIARSEGKAVRVVTRSA